MKKGVKKVLSVALAAGMVVPMVACGSSGGSKTTSSDKKTTKSGGEGKVLNIQCWNDEFARRLRDHYPDFKPTDKDNPTKGGTIGDVKVTFTVTPSDNNAYQNNLDEVLPQNADAKADKKVDLFLIEADYARKYINTKTPVTEKISDLGITDTDLANQYQYTKDVVTDSNGDLRGVSWQGCPGLLIYNRSIAKAMWGDDSPETVQAHVKDWDTFNATASDLKAKGYKVESTVNDSYRVYSQNAKTPWVDKDGKIQIDANIMKWVDDSKKLVDAGETGTDDLWSDGWKAGFKAPGDTFCYFGPAWLINFSMGNAPDSDKGDDGSIAHAGGWGACAGPESFNWGGTWICAAKGTDNKTLIADIMKKMTCDKDTMLDIVKKDSDFVNNQPAMEEAAKDDSYAFKVLGGQNPLPLFCEGAKKISMKNLTDYDQGCTESFQKAMKDYFTGNATKDQALDNFYADVIKKYPNLKK